MTKEQFKIEAESKKAEIGWGKHTPMYEACCREIDMFYGIGLPESEGECQKVIFDSLKNELMNIIHPT